MIHIYTDGGCSGNPGPGGWAYVIIRTEDPRNGDLGIGNSAEAPTAQVLLTEDWGAEKSTTNNRMELLAVISALEILPTYLRNGENITVYTDSQYVQKGITLWIRDWKRREWKTSDKKPVKNQDLWIFLDTLAEKFRINWVWIKGHDGNKYNERCDLLTQKAIAHL